MKRRRSGLLNSHMRLREREPAKRAGLVQRRCHVAVPRQRRDEATGTCANLRSYWGKFPSRLSRMLRFIVAFAWQRVCIHVDCASGQEDHRMTTKAIAVVLGSIIWTTAVVGAQAPDPAKVAAGKQVFEETKCTKCHGEGGVGDKNGKQV